MCTLIDKTAIKSTEMTTSTTVTLQKNPKDVILVNCQEVPEMICVETLFISDSAKQGNKDSNVYYLSSNGNFELKKDIITAANNIRPVSNPNTFTLNLQAKPTTAAAAPVQQCQLNQQAQTSSQFFPIPTAITNLNTNILNNLSPGQSLIPTLAAPLSNPNQIQSFKVNPSVLPPIPFGNKSLNISNITRSFNDQTQQTDISAFNKRSIGIDCKLDEELQDINFDCTGISEVYSENPENSETGTFLKFIKENSTQHNNCKECLICGELCKSNKYFYGHMAVHRGKKNLCFKCGHYFENNLFPEHKCQKVQQLQKAFLQCPHYTCNVKAISPLELYDHINEHINNRMYKCSACGKSFCTGQEFLRHLLIRAKCYTSAKRNRFRVYGLELQKERLCRVRVFTLQTFRKCTTLVKTFLSQRAAKHGVCKICLRSFHNKGVYNRHRLMCIAKFQKRLKRKRGK